MASPAESLVTNKQKTSLKVISFTGKFKVKN